VKPRQKLTVKVTSGRERITIAGIDLELIAAPGESPDHQLVWIPGRRVLICGDNFYMSFPNLYAIRGTPYRDVSVWVRSLDLMIGLDAVRRSIDDRDYQWACLLVDYLLALDPPVHEARKLKADALRALAELQTSSNARHYYLSVATELDGRHD
jgi:alkyl sulfatase BDS1-like metallo-beta-lactamase superfamily hydrolase